MSSGSSFRRQGPSNYVACVGSNADGNALVGDGIFFGVDLDVVKNPGVKIGAISDGLSNTAAFSESLLGAGGPNQSGTTADIRLFYKDVSALTQANCDASTVLVRATAVRSGRRRRATGGRCTSHVQRAFTIHVLPRRTAR